MCLISDLVNRSNFRMYCHVSHVNYTYIRAHYNTKLYDIYVKYEYVYRTVSFSKRIHEPVYTYFNIWQ